MRAKALSVLWIGVLCIGLLPESSGARPVEVGFFNPYAPTGPVVVMEALAPTLRKWYVPQTLYLQYQWKQWEYSNYAKDPYRRYVDVFLEGRSHYDIFGNYISRGWKIYEWTQEQPLSLGSAMWKSPYYSSWFDNVLVSSTSKGEFHTAITVGDRIRTTLTPLTFSKPAFNGAQWDFMTDKYALTALVSRASAPGYAARTETQGPTRVTTFTNFLGFRGVIQVGDFFTIGPTYVNAAHWNSDVELGKNSLGGVLSGPLNADNVKKVAIRLSDDSPEDGVGGALLYSYKIFIDGVEHPEIVPLIEGGGAAPGAFGGQWL